MYGVKALKTVISLANLNCSKTQSESVSVSVPEDSLEVSEDSDKDEYRS